jgi:enamine deaminase RidA (YjgF/YER057c/UK114 family)
MRYTPAISAFLALAAVLCPEAAQPGGKKKNPDDVTQTLELPKDPPAVSVGETKRLIFHVSPLSGKGLLTQQTRDALHALLKETGNSPVVHLRAFVAGSGDVRRVPQIVSEVFTEKKLPLPSVTVLLAGGLPLENAQVVLESISVAKRDVNPGGLTFVAGENQPETDPDPGVPMLPLLERALEKLAGRVRGPDALSVSCFVSSIDNSAGLTGAIAGRFPAAAIDLVQSQRAPYSAMAQCEAVARGPQVQSARLAFTGTRVAFPRLDRDLAEAGADASSIVMTHLYPLSAAIGASVLKEHAATSPMTIVPFEGLAFMDASFAVDAVAAVAR